MIAHPLCYSIDEAKLRAGLFGSRPKPLHEGAMSGGFFDNLFDSVWQGVTGLYDALEGAINATIQTIAQLGETLALVVRAAIGDVKWSEVMDSLGEVFQDIGAVVYYLNPYRAGYEWIKQAPLTAHAFNELDKFTGGMITTAVNISDLPARAMRGDAISTQELIKDALLIIQIAAIVFTGPVGIGIMLGTMVGREVCSKQTEARDACMVAFQIAGAAAGSWAGSVTGVTWGTAAEAADDAVISAAEENAWLAGDEAYAQFLQDQAEQMALNASTSFADHLSASATNYLNTAGIDVITQGAIRMCQSGHWVGNRECEILGEVAGNYLISPSSETWDEFLAREVARIGAEELMLQWFPENSKEHQAIRRAWQIKYVDIPVDQTVVVKKSFDPKTFLVLAGGAALALVGMS